MKPIEIELQLDCPLEHAWATFTNIELMPQWVQGFDSIRLLEGEPETVGSIHELVFLEGKRKIVMIETVTAFEPNKQFSFEATTRGMSTRAETLFTRAGAGTIIRSHNSFFATGFFFRMMLPLMKGAITKRMTADFGRLKALAESTAAES
jgi:uncharacterized membrane protein